MVEYTIICDQCSDILDASPISAAEARRLARKAGRLVSGIKEDLCDQCITSPSIDRMSREELIEAVGHCVPRKLAAKKSDYYLRSFLEVNELEEGRLNSEQGSRGLSAGVMVRRNYGA